MRKIDDIRNFIYYNHINKIYLDVDGVIFASCQAIVDIINKVTNNNYKGEDVLSWNFKELGYDFSDDEIECLFKSAEFFDMVKPIAGVMEFIEEYRDNIIIITKGTKINHIRKMFWFEKMGLGDIPILSLPFNISKGIINMGKNSLFIDDSTNNLIESNAEFKIQFREYNDNKTREWQDNWDGYIMYSWY